MAPHKEAIAERYRKFAINEARGQSALYEALATHVADSDELLEFLSRIPPDRHQPNLFFASVRHVAGLPISPQAFDEAVRRYAPKVAALMRSRTTQTNEPGRCAVLLPLLARLPAPLAIMEVGASAGLCLLPDRYRYDYGHRSLEAGPPMRPNAPVFPCVVNELTPLPASLPHIAWREGLDLNPLDVASTVDMNWLEILVWPEQVGRRERLRAAIELAQQDPPIIRRGDLRKDLDALLGSAPRGMTRVVFHTAVLAYVTSQRDRDAFARAVMASGATWISNEVPAAYPDIAAKIPGPRRQDRFLLAVNGEPVAWTEPHGKSIEWFGER
jgi:hypothetical protein